MMDRLKNYTGSLFFKILVSNIIMIMVIVTIITSSSNNIFIDKFKHELSQKNSLVLEQFKDNVDSYIFDTANNLIIYSLNNDIDISRLFKVPLKGNEIYISRTYEKISNIVKSNELYHSVFIYYKNNKLVISNLGSIYLDGKKQGYNLDWLIHNDSNMCGKWFFIRDFKLFQNMRDETGQSMITYITPYPLGVVPAKSMGNIAINIDQQQLYNHVKNLNNSVFGDIFIVDLEGNIVFHNDMRRIARNEFIESHIQNILSEGESGFKFTIHNDEYIAFTTKSSVTDWVYVNILPTSVYIAQAIAIKQRNLFISFVAIVLFMFISAVWAKRIYNPINSLVKKSEKIYADIFGTNNRIYKDDKALDVTLTSLALKVGELQKKIVIYSPELKKNFLRRLFKKKFADSKTIKETMQRLNITFLFTKFWCISIKLVKPVSSNDTSIDYEDSVITDTLKYDLINFIENIKTDYCFKMAADVLDSYISVLVNAEEYSKVLELSNDIIEYGKKSLNCFIAIGIGTAKQNIYDIWESYKESKNAVIYSFIYTEQHIFEAVETKKWEQSSWEFNSFYIDEFEKALNEGNLRLVQNTLDDIYSEFISNKCSYKKMETELYYLRSIIQKRINILGFRNENVDSILNCFFEKASDLYCVINMFKYICKKVILFECEMQDNKISEKIDRIKQYIVDKINKGEVEDLSLLQVAERFNYNPNYLSKVFRESVGMNFKDYVTDIKLIKAEKDLHNRDIKINDVAKGVGYYNTSYFIKIFKQKYGLTPKQYFNRIHLNQ